MALKAHAILHSGGQCTVYGLVELAYDAAS